MSASRGGISFVLCTGDAVKHGQTYGCWREWDRSRVMRDYMVAMIPGNKEYYRSEGRTRWHDRWFASARNNPENGAPGLAGTYWFLYGGVLFVGIDTLGVDFALSGDAHAYVRTHPLRDGKMDAAGTVYDDDALHLPLGRYPRHRQRQAETALISQHCTREIWCAKQSSIATCEMKGVRAD